MKILIFFGLMILGFLLVRYSKWIVDNTGRFAWPERVIGSGASYSVWKLFGLLAIILGFYYLFS